jgi:hypothetical protein
MSDANVKVLTVRQPWAVAIIDGHKDIENRSGGFTTRHRGPVLIHAAQQLSARGLLDDRIIDAYPRMAERELVRGAVIGAVIIDGAHHAEPGCCESAWADYEYPNTGDRPTTDIVHLELIRPSRLGPARWPGRLGLWRAPAELLDEVGL